MKSFTVTISLTILWLLWLILLLTIRNLPPPEDETPLPVDVKMNQNFEISYLVEKSDKIKKDLDDLTKTHTELKKLIEKNNFQNNQPSKIYENSRRALDLDLQTLWYTLHQNWTMKNTIKNQADDLYAQIQSNLFKLRASDGYELFRQRETRALTSLVFDKIHDLQNPEDCDQAKKLICQHVDCNFACQIGHLTSCLIKANSLNRTLIIDPGFYAEWNTVFVSLSDTCRDYKIPEIGHDRDTLVLYSPLESESGEIIPRDIGSRLEKVHGEPDIWWRGQFVKYLTNIIWLQPKMRKIIDKYIQSLDLTSPTVGILLEHKEENLRHFEQYMYHAENYFNILNKIQPDITKKIYIASNDPEVIKETERYQESNWAVISDQSDEKSNDKLEGILKSVFSLAKCDFLVCTWTSEICRLAYELMQTTKTDASGRLILISLDDPFSHDL